MHEVRLRRSVHGEEIFCPRKAFDLQLNELNDLTSTHCSVFNNYI